MKRWNLADPFLVGGPALAKQRARLLVGRADSLTSSRSFLAPLRELGLKLPPGLFYIVRRANLITAKSIKAIGTEGKCKSTPGIGL